MLPNLLKKPKISDPMHHSISRKTDSPQRLMLRDSEHCTMHTFLFTVSRENFQTIVFFLIYE